MKDKTIIMRDSPLAASIKTVTGWVSSNGRFYGDNEDLARYDGATHQKCKSNPDHPIFETRSYCRACSDENSVKRFEAMEAKPWDGETPVAFHDDDQYFWSIGDLFDRLCDEGISLSAVRLVHCKPAYPREIDPNEYYEDDLPDGIEVSNELASAFEALNEVIRNQGPLCWYQDKYRVAFSQEQLDEFAKCWKETEDATAAWNAKYPAAGN